MILACLSGFALWLLLTGYLPTWAAVSLASAGGILLALLGHHEHGDVLSLDVLAHPSGFRAMNPALKMACCLALLVLSILVKSPWTALGLFVYCAVWTMLQGKVSLHEYASLIGIPILFLVISLLALLLDYSHSPVGIWAMPFGKGGWLVMTQAARSHGTLVSARALGAVSVLYLLSVSTPLSDHTAVLRRLHVPPVITDLAVLIYRYIFVLLQTYRSRKAAAESRLGYGSFSRSIRTTGQIYAHLLTDSYRRADACFSAMESRGYDEEIRFLTRPAPFRLRDFLLFAVPLIGLSAALALGW